MNGKKKKISFTPSPEAIAEFQARFGTGEIKLIDWQADSLLGKVEYGVKVGDKWFIIAFLPGITDNTIALLPAILLFEEDTANLFFASIVLYSENNLEGFLPLAFDNFAELAPFLNSFYHTIKLEVRTSLTLEGADPSQVDRDTNSPMQLYRNLSRQATRRQRKPFKR